LRWPVGFSPTGGAGEEDAGQESGGEKGGDEEQAQRPTRTFLPFAGAQGPPRLARYNRLS
jgi:hypothetical protein